VEFSIRAGSPIRYKISPSQITLKGGETVLVEIRLRVLTHTKPKALFSATAAGVSPSAAASVPVAAEHERGIKDIFHIRSEFFTQKFYATWYAWSATAAAPAPSPSSSSHGGIGSGVGAAAGQIAHNLPDNTLTAYTHEGGAASIHAQRTETEPEARKTERARSRSAERSMTKAASESKPAAVAAAASASTKTEQAKLEEDIRKPFERSSLSAAQARQGLSHTSLLPPSIGGTDPAAPPPAVTTTAASSTRKPVPTSAPAAPISAPSAALVSGKEYLELSAAHRAMGAELDARNLQLQQSEFAYQQMESEYKFVLSQLESAKSAVAAANNNNGNIQDQLNELMRLERAEVERKNQKVLSLLLAKDAAIAERDSELDALQSALDEATNAAAQAEQQMAEIQQQSEYQAQRAADEIKKLKEEIKQISQQANAAKIDQNFVASLQARQEELITERDSIESTASSLRFQLQTAENNVREHAALLRAAKEREQIANERARQAEIQLAARGSNNQAQEIERLKEHVEELLRELAEERASKASAAKVAAAADPYSHAGIQQEREELHNLVVELQHRADTAEHQLSQLQTESGRQIANLQKQLSDAQSNVLELETSLSNTQAQLTTLSTHESARKVLSPPGSPIAASNATAAMANNSQVLAAKHREVEELRVQNADLLRSLHESEETARRLQMMQQSDTTQSPAANTAAFSSIESLRASLLLTESELASKSASVTALNASLRELQSRYEKSELANHTAQNQLSSLNANLQETWEKYQIASKGLEERDRALHDLAEAHARIESLQTNHEEQIHASAELESRLEAQSRATEQLYQSEMNQLKKMMISMIAQTQAVCEGGSVALTGAAASISSDASSSNFAGVDPSALLSDFQSVLNSLQALTASRDTHKLSEIRLQKRLQFLERSLEEAQIAGVEAAERAKTSKEEHEIELDTLQRRMDAQRDQLEQKVQLAGQETLRLQHTLAQMEANSAQQQSSLEDVESQRDALTLQLKKASLESQERLQQSALVLEEVRLELAKSTSSVSEKSQQISVLMETIEALQQSAFQADRDSARAGMHLEENDGTTSTAHSIISAKLISFAAQLSSSKASEALLRRSLKTSESALSRARTHASHTADELFQTQSVTLAAAERKASRALAAEKALKIELTRTQTKLQSRADECIAARLAAQKAASERSLLLTQIESLQTELKEQRKRHIEYMQQAQEEQKRALQDYVTEHGGTSVLGATVTHGSKHGFAPPSSSSTGGQQPLAGAALLAALKDLTTSITQAATTTSLPFQTQLFSPFTPQKKRSSSSSTILSTAAPSSPQFVLGSPSAPAVATVAPSASESAAVLPAIFERLLNIVLANENALLHSEHSASLASFQLQRLAVAARARESENDSLRSKAALYAAQHDKLLNMLKQKGESTATLVQEQQQSSYAKIDELEAALFQVQQQLAAAHSDESVWEKQVAKLQAEVQRLHRLREVSEQEHAQEILQLESTTTAAAEQRRDAQYAAREEHLKQYVEQLLRPLLLGSDVSSAAPEISTQLSTLSASLVALKAVEASTLAELENLRKSQTGLQAQVDGWKTQCKALEQRLKEAGLKYVDSGSSDVTSSRRRRDASPPYSSRIDSRSPQRSNDVPRSKQQQQQRSLSPDSHTDQKQLREEVSQLHERESRLLLQLRKSTSVQQQLEDTIEQLLAAKRDLEQQISELTETERSSEQHTAAAERDSTTESSVKESESDSASSHRKKAPISASSASRASAVGSVKKKPSSVKKKKSTSNKSSESAMSNTLANTVLQVSKQLRERDRSAEEKQAEISRLTSQLTQHKDHATSLASQLKRQKAELLALQSLITSKDAELSGRQSMLTQCEARTKELTTQVGKLEASNQILTDQLSALTTATSSFTSGKLAQDLQQLQQELLPSTAENAQLKIQIQTLQQQLAQSLALENSEREKNLQLNEKLNQNAQLREELQAAAHTSDKAAAVAIDALERCKNDFKKDRFAFDEEIKARENEMNRVKNILSTIEKNRNELRLQHEHSIRQYTLEITQSQERIHQLEGQINKEIEERQRYQRREEDFINQIHSLEQNKRSVLDTQKDSNEKYRIDLSQMQQANELLESTLEKCNKELHSFAIIQKEYELVQAELKALRCQHMDYISEINKEREGHQRIIGSMEIELNNARKELTDHKSTVSGEIEHQKQLYSDMIIKLRTRISQLVQEQEESDMEASELEKKLNEVTDMNVANAAARVKAEEERDLLVARFESSESNHKTILIELESRYNIESQCHAAEFKNLQNNFENFRKGHESLIQVYQIQHEKLMGRLRKSLETVQDLQEKLLQKDQSKKNTSAGDSKKPTSVPYVSEASKNRLVFDMAELLSNLAEREAVVRNLTGEIEQYKRALSAATTANANANASAPISVARPLTAILSTSTTTHTNTSVPSVLKMSHSVKTSSSKGVTSSSSHHAHHPRSDGNKENISAIIHVEELSPPLSWSEERSLAVLGSELANMEIQLRHAQRMELNEKENVQHLEMELGNSEKLLHTTREKLKATAKELSALQRHTTGTIKAQEAELVKMSESLHTEEEWIHLTRAVTEGKNAIKQAKIEIDRKQKQLNIAADDGIRLRTQLEELEANLTAKEGKINKLTRALQSKETLVADLKKRFEDAVVEEKNAGESKDVLTEKLKAATVAGTRKDASIKELRSRAEIAEKEAAIATAQLQDQSGVQSKIRQLNKELTSAHRHIDQLTDERNLLEKQKIELSNQIDIWKATSHKQSVGQKHDLEVLEREAARIGAAYDTVRDLIREIGMQQVHAIEKLSETLADLDSAASASASAHKEQEAEEEDLSLQDVHSLGIAAEFSKDDLEDIITTTLRIGSNIPREGTLSRSGRTSAFARRLFAELELQLARDLSQSSILLTVREQLLKLLDERVRLELLVLQAATSSSNEEQESSASHTNKPSGSSRINISSAVAAGKRPQSQQQSALVGTAAAATGTSNLPHFPRPPTAPSNTASNPTHAPDVASSDYLADRPSNRDRADSTISSISSISR
jgi:chromosome segregation ATPase